MIASHRKTSEVYASPSQTESQVTESSQLHTVLFIKKKRILFRKNYIALLTGLGDTDEFGRTPLHNAILGKQSRMVEVLLSRGANVQVQDERRDTPLHTAVRVGDEAILQVGKITAYPQLLLKGSE